MIIRTPFHFTTAESASEMFPRETLQQLPTQPETKISHNLFDITLEPCPLQKPFYHLRTQTLKHKQTGQQIEVIRQITPIFDSYDFNKLSDFLYQPPYTDQQLLKMFTNSFKQGSTQITDPKMIECLYPQFYLKPFNLKPLQTDLFQSKIKDIEPRKFGISIKFGDPIPSTPTQQPPQSIKSSKLFTALLQFYQQRPIFLKNVLFNQLKTNGISCTIYKLKSMLSYITYYYKDGPWKNCHVKFNYNPVEYHTSVIYQVIVIKIKNKEIEEFESGVKPKEIYDPTFTEVENISKNYSAYQLCDLEEDIREIVRGSLGRGKGNGECDKMYGWLAKQEYKKIFKMMKRKIKK